MAEEISSLRTAIDKIMGWPAAGEGNGAVALAPAPATTVDLNNALGTAATLTNPEPVAAAPVVATTPAAITGLGAGKPQLTYADQLRSDLAISGVTGDLANDIVSRDLANRGFTAETMYDPSTMALHPEIAARPADFQTTTTRIGNPVTMGTWKPK